MKRYEKGQGTFPVLFLALPALCLIIGIVLFSLGIRNTVSDQTKGYEKTTGRLVDYTLYEAGGYDAARKTETADTYRLIYNYTVNGETYTLSTDYGTSFVPSFGSETEILYNPKNPGDSVIGGPNQSGNHLIFICLFFALGGALFFRRSCGGGRLLVVWLRRDRGGNVRAKRDFAGRAESRSL